MIDKELIYKPKRKQTLSKGVRNRPLYEVKNHACLDQIF